MKIPSIADHSRLARRQILQAGLLAGLTGCSADLLFLDQAFGRPLRLATPWGSELCGQWLEQFQKWLIEQKLGPVQVQWFTLNENDLPEFKATHLAGSVDALLGGHYRHHQQLHAQSRLTFRLAPVQTPAVVESIEMQKAGWEEVAEPGRWPVAGPALALNSPLEENLSQAYALAVWSSNPDQSIGYARWIKLARGLRANGSTRQSAQLALVPLGKDQPEVTTAWRGGAGLLGALGLQADDATYWPEAISFFEPDMAGATNRELFQRFCVESKRVGSTVTGGSSSVNEFAIDLAAILLDRCRADLQAAWLVIDRSTGEEQARTERYLTERPPWPPASVQDLAKRRGFEYVVALVEQMAVDGDERDWLIHEFQKPSGLVDLIRLDKAMDGRLKNSIRFRSWLRSEWAAWVRQRCRRVERFLTEL